MKIYTNDLVKGHSDFKVKCLTFGLYTQVSDSGPLGPLVLEVNPYFFTLKLGQYSHIHNQILKYNTMSFHKKNSA